MLTKFKYLGYDDCRALIKKCIWELCDIGTEEAIQKIEELSHSKNKVVAEEAVYRLTQMHKGQAEQ